VCLYLPSVICWARACRYLSRFATVSCTIRRPIHRLSICSLCLLYIIRRSWQQPISLPDPRGRALRCQKKFRFLTSSWKASATRSRGRRAATLRSALRRSVAPILRDQLRKTEAATIRRRRSSSPNLIFVRANGSNKKGTPISESLPTLAASNGCLAVPYRWLKLQT
jgi:hypothetical protein